MRFPSTAGALPTAPDLLGMERISQLRRGSAMAVLSAQPLSSGAEVLSVPLVQDLVGALVTVTEISVIPRSPTRRSTPCSAD